MSLYYSASNKGFYDSSIHTEIPSDAVEITAEQHQELLDKQASGKVITADENGSPIFSDPPAPTNEQLAASARAHRDQLIAETDYLVFPDYPITAEKMGLVKAYRQLLRDIPKQPRFPTEIDWPPLPDGVSAS